MSLFSVDSTDDNLGEESGHTSPHGSAETALIKKDIRQLIRQTNEQPHVDLLGSKSMNSMQLQKLATESGGLFSAPRQVCIPNTVLDQVLLDEKTVLKGHLKLLDKCEFAEIQKIRAQILQVIDECLQENSAML